MTFIENYTEKLLGLLKAEFAERLVYAGLQGSYMRGEETSSSDIDIMVVIDGLSVKDLALYKDIIRKAGDYERACGFICGREELSNWNPMEICHLVHTTKDLYGSIKDIVPEYTEADERNYIKLSINNLYHELCHSNIHSDGDERNMRFRGCCKSLFFILQNIYFLKTGSFYATKQKLAAVLEGEDKAAFEAALNIQRSGISNYEHDFALLFEWCQKYAQSFK